MQRLRQTIRPQTPPPEKAFAVFKLFYCDHFVLPLPADHRFPMSKYALLRQAVMQAELTAPENVSEPPAAADSQLRRAHTPAYLARVQQGSLTPQEIRRIGFPWSPQMVERSRRSVGGTIAACRAALRWGSSANLAGGTHHAHADWGQGFCVFNDAVVAARAMQAEGLVRRVILIDCDVHQGNGSADITAADPTIFTFSIHGEKNFPFHKAHSDLDVGLPDGTTDAPYLAALTPALEQALDQAQAGLAIYLAGADPFVGDRFGRLSLTKAGLAARDELVYAMCRHHRLPIATVMAGGYAPNIHDIVAIHLQTLKLASQSLPH